MSGDPVGPEPEEPSADDPVPDPTVAGPSADGDADQDVPAPSDDPVPVEPVGEELGLDDVDAEFAAIVAAMDLRAPVADDPDQAPDGRAGRRWGRPRSDEHPPPDDVLHPTSGPVFDPRLSDAFGESDRDPVGPADRFVPPDPGPGERMALPTRLAWVGAVGAPLFLVFLTAFGLYISSTIATLVVAAFVTGVVYLIVSMSRDPREDGDDGAVL